MKSFPSQFRYAYHRTNGTNIASIAKNGFVPGGGAMYGRGWYMCYDLDSQLNYRMKFYGDSLIKSEIFPKGLLIFDYNISKKIYGADYTLVDQLLEQDIFRSEDEIPKVFYQMSKVLEQTFTTPSFSAAIAANSWTSGKNPVKVGLYDSAEGWGGNKNSFLDQNTGTPKNKKITGIMFSGNHDGNVVVIYNPDTAKPIEYATVDLSSGGSMTVDDINWIPIDEADVVEKRVSLSREIYDMFNGTMLSIEIDPKSHIRNMSMFKSKFPWMMKAKFSDAEFRIDEDDQLSMKSGTWFNGTWKGRFMYSDVIFKGGIFEGTELFVGFWINGTWNLKGNAVLRGKTNSRSSFNYNEDGDFVRTKDDPDEYFK